MAENEHYVSLCGNYRVSVVTLTLTSHAKTTFPTCGDGQQYKVEMRAPKGGWYILGYVKNVSEIEQWVSLSQLREA